MATSLLQVRIDDNLKEEAAKVFEAIGIDTSVAVRMFLKRAVMEKGIPFSVKVPGNIYIAEKGYQAMVDIAKESERNGLSDMSLEEINDEINASRLERRKKKGG